MIAVKTMVSDATALLDLAGLREWHSKSLYNAPADMKHNGYVCFYCLRTIPAGDIDHKHVIDEGGYQPRTLRCQKCDIDSVLTKETLESRGIDIGSAKAQLLLEQLHLAYFMNMGEESEASVLNTIAYFKLIRNHDLEYSHTPEDVLNHVAALRTPQTQHGEIK